MLNRLLFLLLAPALVFSGELSKTYLFPPPVIQNGKIIMIGCFIAESEFAPCVAARSITLMIPVGHKVVSCKVDYGHSTILSGTHYVKPSIPPTPLSQGPLPLSKKSMVSAHYAKNAFYPNVASGPLKHTVQYKSGIPILSAIINPVAYNPVTRQVRYHENVAVTVETAPAAAANAYITVSGISEIKAMVENPEIVASLPISQATERDYEYVILCKSIFANSFGDFIAFNTRRGLRTKVFTLDQVKAAVPAGADIPERVRSFIKRQHDSCHIRFVLIASDDDPSDPTAIPHRGFWAKFYDHDLTPGALMEDNNIPADMYYGCLTGDWKTDASKAIKNFGFYGTEDIPAEVFVGRFCVRTIPQLTNMITKTIRYSEQPVAGSTNNCMLAGEFLWYTDMVPYTASPSLANLIGHSVTGASTHNGYTTYGFPSSHWTITEVSHERNPGWWEGNFSLRDSLFYSGIATNKCSWVNHYGHASTDFAIGTVSTSASSFYDNGRNPVLSDNSWKYSNGIIANFFFLTSGACFTSSFDNFLTPGTGTAYYSPEDCWMAVATRAATGPVAGIGNSRYGLGDNDGTDGASDRPIRFIHDAMFNPTKRFHYAGMMLAKAKETDMARITLAAIPTRDITLDVPYYGALKYTNYELNLLGDPALSLWTSKPQKLALEPVYRDSAIMVDTRGPYSSVALLNNSGKIFYAMQTGINGIAVINDPLVKQYITANQHGTLRIKVKAHNYLPDSATVPLIMGIQGKADDISASSRLIRSSGNMLQLGFSLADPALIRVNVYSAHGALVRCLMNRVVGSGTHSEYLPLGRLSTGVYFCKFDGNNQQQVTKFYITK